MLRTWLITQSQMFQNQPANLFHSRFLCMSNVRVSDVSLIAINKAVGSIIEAASLCAERSGLLNTVRTNLDFPGNCPLLKAGGIGRI